MRADTREKIRDIFAFVMPILALMLLSTANGALVGAPSGNKDGQEATVQIKLTEVPAEVGGIAFDMVFDGDLLTAPRIQSYTYGLTVITHQVACALPSETVNPIVNPKTLRIVILRNPAANMGQTWSPILEVGLQVKDVATPPANSKIFLLRETAGDTGRPADSEEKRPRAIAQADIDLHNGSIGIEASAKNWLRFK